jgi:DNA (cytosine-5)-methyltransferase 1
MGGRPIQATDYVADSDGEGPQRAVLDYASEGLPRPRGGKRGDQEQDIPETTRGWWQAEPAVGRVAHGVPDRVDRLRCLGNAVVPQVAEVIGRAILEFESVAS